ncbi:LemA family protein [Treponema pectinovorum]|uniref:LemA family protein n=1 Tax=Treponema pectinovorum TaxID=164 RepID=UPI0011C8A94D|nr:LemA family protein [Treponema pectinovorum]
MKGLKKFAIIAAVIAVIALILYNFFAGNYNKMVTLDESVTSAWSQVENQYQRRLDLIPNLVSTVKGYASHESEVFEQVAEARSRAGGIVKVDSSILEDSKKLAEYQKIQNELGASLQRLLAISENYPQLKANQNFLALQDELAGTENRISVERKRFNDAVRSYNSFIRKFPQNIIANMNGFEKKAYFEAETAASKAPTVSF